MTLETLVVWIIVGALAGWLASLVVGTNRSQGLLADILVGIVGGILGGFLLTSIGIEGLVTGINLGSIAVAFIGAVVLLLILRVFTAGTRGTRLR
ncbi:MAG: GlsB/YeaQ/YmgE family stress response membrane protein [Anaerolineae bacterium]|nr:GlsB/YeaQ/YmgE family stress response membrane protein [Anaerolineae bacterium]